MIGELAAGGALGTCVVLGAYYAMAGTLTEEVIWLSIPPGLLTAVLLLLNEFPDVEPDREGGRRHLVIALGKRWAAIIYTLILLATYAILVIGAATKLFPWTVLIALITVPIAARACVIAIRHNDSFEKMLPALGANVMVVLGTDLLIAVGYFVG
jgi:1,4-dihydroxy-2-naphthoate octaprenyltransferase